MVTRGGTLLSVSYFLFFPEEVGRQRRGRSNKGEEGKKEHRRRRQDVKTEVGYDFFPSLSVLQEGLWSVWGSHLPVVSRMSHAINHAPKLKMTGNFSRPSRTARDTGWVQRTVPYFSLPWSPHLNYNHFSLQCGQNSY